MADSLSESIHDLEDKICALRVKNAACSEVADEKIKLLTQAVDRAADAFLLIDETGRFVDMNLQACRSLGYSREEMLEMSISDIDVSVSKESFRKIYHAIVEYGAISIEGIHQRKDGSQFPEYFMQQH
jgi:PAS domain S-box-containing protein